MRASLRRYAPPVSCSIPSPSIYRHLDATIETTAACHTIWYIRSASSYLALPGRKSTLTKTHRHPPLDFSPRAPGTTAHHDSKPKTAHGALVPVPAQYVQRSARASPADQAPRQTRPVPHRHRSEQQLDRPPRRLPPSPQHATQPGRRPPPIPRRLRRNLRLPHLRRPRPALHPALGRHPQQSRPPGFPRHLHPRRPLVGARPLYHPAHFWRRRQRHCLGRF